MTSISARGEPHSHASGCFSVQRCPSIRCSTTCSSVHHHFIRGNPRCPRPSFVKGHYGDCRRIVPVVADADQSFPVFAYPLSRLEDCEWLSTRLLPNDNVVETEADIRCFEDSLFRRKPASSVSTSTAFEPELASQERYVPRRHEPGPVGLSDGLAGVSNRLLRVPGSRSCGWLLLQIWSQGLARSRPLLLGEYSLDEPCRSWTVQYLPHPRDPADIGSDSEWKRKRGNFGCHLLAPLWSP